jgi:hypothetical protein
VGPLSAWIVLANKFIGVGVSNYSGRSNSSASVDDHATCWHLDSSGNGVSGRLAERQRRNVVTIAHNEAGVRGCHRMVWVGAICAHAWSFLNRTVATNVVLVTPPNKSLHASRDCVFVLSFLEFNGVTIARPRELRRYARTPGERMTMKSHRFLLLVSVTSCLICVGCSKRSTGQTQTNDTAQTSTARATPTPDPFELNRETALAVIRPKLTKRVEAWMPKYKTGFDQTYHDLYMQMSNAGVLSCQVDPNPWAARIICDPGPKGRQFSARGDRLILFIGNKVPSVEGVSKTDRTTAVIQVSLTFQSGGGYNLFRQWQSVFQQPILSGEPQYNTDNEQHTVHLRLYDNGWRIEKID